MRVRAAHSDGQPTPLSTEVRSRACRPLSAGCAIADERVVRFRCRSGHGYTAGSLPSGQENGRESLLASIYGALLKEAALAAQLSALPAEAEDAAHVTYLQERVARLRGDAEQIGAWMRTASGLIDPEP